MEDGQVKFDAAPTDLNALARLAVEQNTGHAAEKGISLECVLQNDLPQVAADDSRISQVMDNLVGNAVKFSPGNSRIRVCTRAAADQVFFEVQDNGPGLSDEDLGLLFVKYAKLSNLPTGNEKSTGLGLAICKRMIELQGGAIGGRNNPDGGATFWFSLPVQA